MLQAVQLESNAAPAKIRSGTDNGSDPALAVFAGMMAQANAPSTRPSSTEVKVREAPAEARALERVDPREPQRPQEPMEVQKAPDKAEEAKVAEKPSAAPPAEAETPVETPAPAQTAAQKTPEAQVKGLAPGSEVPLPLVAPAAQATAGLPAGDVAMVAAPQATQVPSEASVVQAAPAAPQSPDKPETKPLPVLPKELQATVETSDTAVETRPQSALRELLHLPKVEIQTPKLTPEAASKVHTGPVTAPTQTLTGEPQDEGTSKGAEGADPIPAETLVKAPSQGLNHPATFKLDLAEAPAPQALTPKAGTPEASGMALPGLARAAPTATRAEAALPARPNPVAAQVEGSIRWILNNKTQGAELQLHPESLGRVVIQLKVDGQEVHARLWASESSSMAVLQDHKAFLETSLKEQGLILSSFDLHSGARGNGAQTAFQEQVGSMPKSLPHLEIKQEMPTELRMDPADPYRVEVYA